MTAGAVLCGGASRRMGTDKAVLAVDGVAMAARVAQTLTAAGCTPVRCIGGDAAALGALGLEVVADGWPGEGPLGGVRTALADVPADGVVVAACDLPALAPDAVRALLAARRPGVDVVVAASDGRPALVAWWAPTAAAVLEPAWAEGVRALHAAYALDELHVVRIEVPAVVLHNVNRPADLHLRTIR